MSITKSIKEYHKGLDQLDETGGLFHERDTERLFANLLDSLSKENHYFTRSDSIYTTDSNTQIRFDTAVYTGVGIVYGVHEAKKYDIDLEKAIKEKRERGYPFFNIIFENSKEAVLFQNGKQYNGFIDVRSKKDFTDLLGKFFSYTSPDIQKYNASQQEFFKQIPDLVKRIREFFDKARGNEKYKENIEKFEALLKETINPNISRFETREIIVQHFLTIDIFSSVFSEFSFEKYNPIARELEKITRTIFDQILEKYFSRSIQQYLNVVKKTAVNIQDFGIKKQFLINFYEQFYKVYNPKAADRLGVVYTPEPVVKFMIRNTDELLQKHFKKNLSDENVNIIDPATGTGTFIYDLLEYLFNQSQNKAHQEKIKKKYNGEIHANEVSILPYYIASLCIEKVYYEHTKDYHAFEGIVYQDTLENLFYKGHGYTDIQKEGVMFQSISQENVERQAKQSNKEMTVIIGNPPYNANQQNENENNKNREYPIIDQKIKDTYIEESTAQKTKVYDMYTRFIRWASDRIQDNGIIALVTNNSFVNSRSYDGFRKIVEKEFDFIYVVDMGGDIRKLSGKDGIWLGENHTIFGLAAAVGIAITFFIKTNDKHKHQIKYIHPLNIRATRIEKLDYLEKTNINDILFDEITPNSKNYWLDTEESDFDDYIPTISKNKEDKTIFKVSSLGVATNRDTWVYDFDERILKEKMEYFIHIYKSTYGKCRKVIKEKDYQSPYDELPNYLDYSIKWTRKLKKNFLRDVAIEYNKKLLINSLYRPFSKKFYYNDYYLSEEHYQNKLLFGPNLDKENICICYNQFPLAHNKIVDLHFTGDSCIFPLYHYEENQRKDNIIDWALGQFQSYYHDKSITKINIFHYIYAVLNNTGYTQKYAIQLTRETPRIPFYKNFKEFAKLGKELMSLHIDFEKVEPLKGVNVIQKNVDKKQPVIPRLKSDKESGVVILDNQTSIEGIPSKAYEYKLGLRSPIEWVLDQHKLLKGNPSNMANYGKIYEKFNTPENEQNRYERISKPLLIDLIPRLANLSIKTLELRERIGQVVEV